MFKKSVILSSQGEWKCSGEDQHPGKAMPVLIVSIGVTTIRCPKTTDSFLLFACPAKSNSGWNPMDANIFLNTWASKKVLFWCAVWIDISVCLKIFNLENIFLNTWASQKVLFWCAVWFDISACLKIFNLASVVCWFPSFLVYFYFSKCCWALPTVVTKQNRTNS